MTYGQQPGYGRPDRDAPGYPPGYGGPGAYGHSGHGQGGHPQQPYGAPPRYGAPHYAPRHGAPAPHYGAPPYPYGPPAQQYAARTAAPRHREPMPTGGPITDDDERWAVPAYVGMFVVGFVAPAIVYLVKGRTSRFARFHAAQALNLFIAMTACNVVAFVLTYLIDTTGLLITVATVAAEFFFIVKAAIGANRCEWYRLPSFAAWPIIR